LDGTKAWEGTETVVESGNALRSGGLSGALVAVVCLVVIGVVIAAVALLLRGARVTDDRESEVFRDLYVEVDSTRDNPLMTEPEVKFDGHFNLDGDESRL
jgi:hypothetical protein